MKLLLCQNVAKLGIVGDVVEVSPGYGRNFLVPQGLATEPTQTNMRALAEARRLAEEERTRQRSELVQLAEKLEGVEVTIKARANEEGALYGSVGTSDIVSALAEEQYYIAADQICLDRPIRHLDTVSVEVKLDTDLLSTIKVWVVRDKALTDEDSEDSEESQTGMEAGADDYGTSKHE
jgi:large subunit ribosomal protein L9